jgi:hypothetical protein
MLRVARLIASEKIDWPLRVRPVNRETSVTVERIPSINGRRRRYWRIQGTLELMENVIEELCRALNHQLFFALRVEHDYLTSESAIRETIRSNQYYFTENGQMEYGY